MRRRAACWYGEPMTPIGHVSGSLARANPKSSLAVRRITILGATGSVGASTIDLIKRAPERYNVEAISAHRNAGALAQIAREVGAKLAVVADPACYPALKDALAGSGIEAAAGEAALVEAAERPAEWVMAAISGSVGLKPTLAAIERGATVALANKDAWSVPAASSCAGRQRPRPPCCRSTASIMPCSRRLAPAGARTSSG
jgi:1-deoxy-D-xylulose-5-phosphate reductoisomerase